ncbi:hypothetical protein BDY17DRAFT_296962 [Neohortaea acidophila]|uniref:RNA helicase n=1 Tax=Neohortaea acidophila TaxID=245834 RepID=A0A6A6PT72_9PEZI|nr:uncharacterized protein BDY17DRAFT_296962 [Neohortaea acidophila]KAF2483182.1 hypothetical protein BDY17DRAFT_296962 [Neohortaea acidophila]
MLSASRRPGRCIYCAFRSQQSYLQSLRHRRSLHLRPSPSHCNEGGLIRYTNAPYQIGTHYPQQEARERRAHARRRDEAKDLRGSNVRKVFFGKGDAPQHDTDRRWKLGFEDALRQRLEVVRDELQYAPIVEELKKENAKAGEHRTGDADGFNKLWAKYKSDLFQPPENSTYSPTSTGPPSKKRPETAARRLLAAYDQRGVQGLDNRIKHEFYAHITNARFTPSDIRNQRKIADLRYPGEWFPATRTLHRKIFLHVGPTNSGKTYRALQRLEQAKAGVYAGPLRLLAHEVYSRLNAKDIPCYLITGEERRLPEKPSPDEEQIMSACTVEMVPLNRALDVAVIDEIQMIGNAERGWAWTQALLGVRAQEVHLCGEERTVPLIQEICASMGEELEIHRYQRLSPLEVASESLDGDLRKLRKGDCIVSFSVMGIHSLRRQIERVSGRKVAVVYGSLPPETRAQQARLFNDPDNEYDFLVASDAVGMGLNLAIKRIIFEASSKFDGDQHRTLQVADIKQIGGRAGRYRTAAQAMTQSAGDKAEEALAAAKGDVPATPPSDLTATAAETKDAPPSQLSTPSTATAESTGYVTTLEKIDYPIVSTAMVSDPEPIRTAGLFPPGPVLERFSGYFPPRTPFSYILTRLHELSQTHTRFHLCGLRDSVWIADLIEPVEGLTITDRNIICSCPASPTDRELWKDLMPALARCVAEQAGGDLVDLKEIPLETLEAEVSTSRDYLRALERLHKSIVAYLWLSYRFAGVFGQRALAFHTKSLVEEKIETVLAKFSFSEKEYRKIAAQREQLLLKEMEKGAEAAEHAAFGDEDGVVGDENATDDAAEPIGEDEDLREQTSLIAGGDRFAGEEDLGLQDDDYGGSIVSGTIENGTDKASDASRVGVANDVSSDGLAANATTPDASHLLVGRSVLASDESERSGRNEATTNRKQRENTSPGHLAHLDAIASEAERGVASRR